MLRLCKMGLGLLLLPVCAGMTLTLLGLFEGFKQSRGLALPPNTLGFVVGFSLWILLYLTLPRPARSYVLAHEMTHALWAHLFGVRVMGMKVGRDQGHVLLSGSNFLITLAPYFFPFYTLCSLLLYGLFSLAWDQKPYAPFWMGLVGLTWSYHFTFTWSALRSGQSDVHEHGNLFSLPVIYLGNVLGLCLWILVILPGTDSGFYSRVLSDQQRVWSALSEQLIRIKKELPRQ